MFYSVMFLTDYFSARNIRYFPHVFFKTLGSGSCKTLLLMSDATSFFLLFVSFGVIFLIPFMRNVLIQCRGLCFPKKNEARFVVHTNVIFFVAVPHYFCFITGSTLKCLLLLIALTYCSYLFLCYFEMHRLSCLIFEPTFDVDH